MSSPPLNHSMGNQGEQQKKGGLMDCDFDSPSSLSSLAPFLANHKREKTDLAIDMYHFILI